VQVLRRSLGSVRQISVAWRWGAATENMHASAVIQTRSTETYATKYQAHSLVEWPCLLLATSAMIKPAAGKAHSVERGPKMPCVLANGCAMMTPHVR